MKKIHFIAVLVALVFSSCGSIRTLGLPDCDQDCRDASGRCDCNKNEDCRRDCSRTLVTVDALNFKGRICELIASCIPPPFQVNDFRIRVSTPAPDEVIGVIVNPNNEVFASTEAGNIKYDQKSQSALLQFGLINSQVGNQELTLRVKMKPLSGQAERPDLITLEYKLGEGIFKY